MGLRVQQSYLWMSPHCLSQVEVDFLLHFWLQKLAPETGVLDKWEKAGEDPHYNIGSGVYPGLLFRSPAIPLLLFRRCCIKEKE